MKNNIYPPRDLQLPDPTQYHTPEFMEMFTNYVKIQQLYNLNYKKVWTEFQQKVFKKGETLQKEIKEENDQDNENENSQELIDENSQQSSEFDNEVRLSSSNNSSDDLHED